ncbi:hypothetical protein EBCG_01246 [Escherichia marmotae]|nr:hypothetical protein EBCG_01246 [Escherichia marmotae]
MYIEAKDAQISGQQGSQPRKMVIGLFRVIAMVEVCSRNWSCLMLIA